MTFWQYLARVAPNSTTSLISTADVVCCTDGPPLRFEHFCPFAKQNEFLDYVMQQDYSK